MSGGQMFFATIILMVNVIASNTSEPAGARLDDRTPYFVRESNKAVGAKGEDTLNVDVTRDASGRQWVFHKAELIVDKQRFGDAQFTAIPNSGCIDCSPLSVRWYHEPTGYLSFRVLVWRRPLDKNPPPQ